MPTWNQRSRVIAMAVALQPIAGQFVQPAIATDLVAVSDITNTHDALTTQDNTATGSVWEGNRIVLGKSATIGATIPLRGPGGAQPPALNAWVPGRIMQSAGWTEIRKAASSQAALVAGSSTTSLALANTESGVDDFLLGAPIQHPAIGNGFKATTIIADYTGANQTAKLAETLAAAPAAGTQYTIPAYLSYVLGTLTTPPPLLSISVWRDKKRYDYRDWRPASLAPNFPVANDANTVAPSIAFSGKGIVQAIVDDTSPSLPSALLAVPVSPYRNGKFYLDRVMLGHQTTTFTETATVGAASNANQAQGQDGYDILSATRAIALDLNQMAVADFDLHGREDSQVSMPMMLTYGLGSGNYIGFIVPNTQLDPFSPGDRNGYVSLTGNAVTTDIDKSAALTIWW
jgi:hypothetical protein